MKWSALGNMVVKLLPRLIGLMEEKPAPPQSGPSKRAMVRDIIIASVEVVEGVTGRDLLNDPEVAAAYDAVNDAIVSFQNIVAKKQAAQPLAPAVSGP